MPKYKVHVYRYFSETAEVIVKADSDHGAIATAREISDDDFTFEPDDYISKNRYATEMLRD